MDLTIAFVTARPEPLFTAFVDSLAAQRKPTDNIVVMVVDALASVARENGCCPPVSRVGMVARYGSPKPTVWQGQHRITKHDWWAMSNARNTAICLCQTEWLAFLDDRLALGPQWLEGVRDAMREGYACCGSYEKRTAIANGPPILSGEDNRLKYIKDNQLTTPYACPGSWWYGCSTVVPLEWALNVNGYDESCDGLGAEDSIFGTHLANHGYPIRFDPRMHVIEDRTPGQLGPIMKREDKGVSPNDKSHALLARLRDRKEAAHTINLRQIREDLAKGLPFPMPQGPHVDWFDGQPLGDM